MTNETAESAGRARFRVGVLFNGSGTVIQIGLLLLETIVAVRLLSMESYGVYVLLVAIVNVFLVAIDCGIKTTVTRLIASSHGRRQSRIVASALAFRAGVVVVVSTLIWLGHDLLGVLDPSRALLKYLVFVPVMLGLASFDELLTGMLQGFQAYRQMAASQIIRSVLRIILTVALLWGLKLGILALIYSWVISFVVSVAYQYLALPTRKRLGWRRDMLAEMLRFGMPMQLTRLLYFLSSRVHVFLLGALAGPTSVAFYEVASRFPDALLRLSESYTAVYFPTMSALLSGGRGRPAARLLSHTLRLISFASALAALCAVVFGQRLIVLFFSEKYAASGAIFALLMIAFHIGAIGTIFGYTLIAAGHPGRSFGHNLAQSVLAFLGDLVLIPTLGLVGPAIAAIGAGYLANPIGVWLLGRSRIAVSTAPYVKQVAILLFCAALYWCLQPAALAVKLAIVVLFIALNFALSTLSQDDLDLILPAHIWRRFWAGKESVAFRG